MTIMDPQKNESYLDLKLYLQTSGSSLCRDALNLLLIYMKDSFPEGEKVLFQTWKQVLRF